MTDKIHHNYYGKDCFVDVTQSSIDYSKALTPLPATCPECGSYTNLQHDGRWGCPDCGWRGLK